MNMKEFHQEKTAGEAIQSNRHAPVVSNNQQNGRNGEEVTPENLFIRSIIGDLSEFYTKNLAREVRNTLNDTAPRKHKYTNDNIPSATPAVQHKHKGDNISLLLPVLQIIIQDIIDESHPVKKLYSAIEDALEEYCLACAEDSESKKSIL